MDVIHCWRVLRKTSLVRDHSRLKRWESLFSEWCFDAFFDSDLQAHRVLVYECNGRFTLAHKAKQSTGDQWVVYDLLSQQTFIKYSKIPCSGFVMTLSWCWAEAVNFLCRKLTSAKMKWNWCEVDVMNWIALPFKLVQTDKVRFNRDICTCEQKRQW